MGDRRNRFLNLEAPRPLSSPDLKSEAQPSELQQQRMAQLESGLLLDLHSDEEQPFVRCGRCETDAPRGAPECRTCGADLRTAEQRAFNQQLWTKRREEHEREQQLSARRAHEPHEGTVHGPLADDSLSLEAQQRALGIALAAEVKERESDRLAWMGAPRGNLGRDPRSSPGMRVLARISDPMVRLWCGLGCLALGGACLWRLFFHPNQFHPLAWGGLLALAILFAPRRTRGDLDE